LGDRLAACGREVDEGRLLFAPLAEPALTQQLGLSATAQLDLPREFVVKVGNTMREEAERLVKEGGWPARFLSPHPWNPNVP
jgi:LysR family nitrogen assimilation transcriptional regulator